MKLLSFKYVETSDHYLRMSFGSTFCFLIGLYMVISFAISMFTDITVWNKTNHSDSLLITIFPYCVIILLGLLIMIASFICAVVSYWNTHGEERIFIDDEKIVIKRFFHLTRNKDVIYFQDIIDVVPTTGVVGSLLGYAYNPDMITIISRSKARFHDRVTQCGINFTTEEQTAFIAIIKGLVDKKIE